MWIVTGWPIVLTPTSGLGHVEPWGYPDGVSFLILEDTAATPVWGAI